MKFEEVLPALRDGKKVRRASWENKDFTLSFDDLDNSYPHSLYFNDIFADDWEIVEEHEPDWEYIIENKCLCWFWDNDSREVLSCSFRYLKSVDSRKTFPYKDEFGYTWKHCRPVRRDEVTFYEEKEDEDNS